MVPAPPSAGSRWGHIFGELVAMGTGRFGRGELEGGAGDAKSDHPPGISMTTRALLGRAWRVGSLMGMGGEGGRVGPHLWGGGNWGGVLRHQLPVLGTEVIHGGGGPGSRGTPRLTSAQVTAGG